MIDEESLDDEEDGSNREEMKEEFDKKDQIFPSVGRIDTQTH